MFTTPPAVRSSSGSSLTSGARDSAVPSASRGGVGSSTLGGIPSSTKPPSSTSSQALTPEMLQQLVGSTAQKSTSGSTSAKGSQTQGDISGVPPLQIPSAAPPMNITSTPNSTIDGTVLPALLARAQGGMGVPEALRLSQAAQRDTLSGMLKEMGGNAAQRGIAGTGAESLMRGNLASDAARNMAGSADKIAYAGEQDRNALYGQIADTAAGSAGLQMDQQRQALAAWEAQRQALSQERSDAINAYNSRIGASQGQQRINQEAINPLLNLMGRPLF